jgi:hypothetical protein
VPVRISSDDTLFFLGGNFHPAKTEKGCGRHPREGRQTAQIRVPDLHQCSPPKNQVIIKRACEKAGIEVELNEALSKGIVISGLPITVKEPFYSTMDIDNLDWYYEDCVIGGPGSFVIPIKDREKFKEAIRAKLLPRSRAGHWSAGSSRQLRKIRECPVRSVKNCGRTAGAGEARATLGRRPRR